MLHVHTFHTLPHILRSHLLRERASHHMLHGRRLARGAQVLVHTVLHRVCEKCGLWSGVMPRSTLPGKVSPLTISPLLPEAW